MAYLSHVMTLANSIIGVSVLAMPFCFKQCGIILAALILLLSNLLSRFACHLLIKSSVMSRRRNFELLAFYAFGYMGKFLVELFIIGFLVGTCIAFFVVVGDLGPQIVGKLIDKKPDDIRTSLLLITSIFIILPLGLLRNIDSLSSICTATVGFYACLVLKVFTESVQHIFAGDWTSNVYFWRSSGILQCLPIFSMALFCQTQLFEIYETIPNVSLEKMNDVVRGALNICTLVYLCVGFFGYIAFCTQPFTGNILMSFEPSISSDMIKMGFFFSVAFSFPLVIFPCRASLNSLLFRRVHTHEPSINYMPEVRFRCLTIAIVSFSVITGILMPNIEFVLGLVGSTIGVMICLMFPAAFFISMSSKHTNERLLAQAILFVGVWIMVLGTYANLYAMEESSITKIGITTDRSLSQLDNLPLHLNKEDIRMIPVSSNPEILPNVKEKVINVLPNIEMIDEDKHLGDIRQEPPVPVERVAIAEKLMLEEQNPAENIGVSLAPEIKQVVENIKTMNEHLNLILATKTTKSNSVINNNKLIMHENFVTSKTNEDINIIKSKTTNEISKIDNLINSDAIKKEDSELAAEEKITDTKVMKKNEKHQQNLEEQALENLEMLKEQEKLEDLQEKKQELEKEIGKIEKHIEESIKNDNKNNDNDKSNIQKSNSEKVENIDKRSKINKSLGKNKILKKYTIGTNANENVIETPNIKNVNKNIVQDKNDSEQLIDTKDKSNIENVKNIKLKEDKDTDQLHSTSNYQEQINATFDNIFNKSKGSILSALTKGNLIKTILKNKRDIEILQGNKESIVNEMNKSDEILTQNQNNVPLTLQIKSQTNVNKSEKLIDKSDNDVQVMRRDILENHDREKREVTNINDISPDTSTEKIQSFVKDISMNIDRIKCNKKLDDSQIEVDNMSEKKMKQKLPEETTTTLRSVPTSIKTATYLSSKKKEEFTEKPILVTNPDITIRNEYIKLKQRDLKTLNMDYQNRNS